ncbi:serine protease 48-like [Oppia nitens]|uniref:serine protease 48-like n=1 Tax=Oppia nitens TaxID=1686743 RepID=UPI0023DC84F5|nr:serine protease 48-like [Oppia nitens]
MSTTIKLSPCYNLFIYLVIFFYLQLANTYLYYPYDYGNYNDYEKLYNNRPFADNTDYNIRRYERHRYPDDHSSSNYWPLVNYHYSYRPAKIVNYLTNNNKNNNNEKSMPMLSTDFDDSDSENVDKIGSNNSHDNTDDSDGSGDGLGRELYDKTCGYPSTNSVRIIGGRNAPEGLYPWLVVILMDGEPQCGGTIINQYWILTAAHCFKGKLTYDQYTWSIRVGTNDRNRGKTYKIKKVRIHERFNLNSMLNSDIALMKTYSPIEFSNQVKPTCLPNNTYAEPRTEKIVVAGWGVKQFDAEEMEQYLKDVSLTLITDKDCAKKYQQRRQKIFESQFCTLAYKKDTCLGDSGSPAFEKYGNRFFMVGIVSYGAKCADDFPGVYTQVSYFLKWIINTMKCIKVFFC